MRAVLVVGRDVDDPLDVGLLLEHLAEVFVGPDPAARPILLAVVGLHDLPRHVAAGADARVAGAPCGLAEELADVVPVAPRSPVHVVLAVLVGIDDGDELQIRPRHEARVHLPLRLRAAADLGQQDHVARRHEARPAEHAARNDGQAPRRPQVLRETSGD